MGGGGGVGGGGGGGGGEQFISLIFFSAPRENLSVFVGNVLQNTLFLGNTQRVNMHQALVIQIFSYFYPTKFSLNIIFHLSLPTHQAKRVEKEQNLVLTVPEKSRFLPKKYDTLLYLQCDAIIRDQF